MTTRTWLGGLSGRWEDPAAWTPNGVPGPGDSVAFTAGMAATVTSMSSVGFIALSGPGAALTIGGDVFTALGGLTLSTGATLTVAGALAGTRLTLQGGTVAGYGTLEDDTLVGTLALDGLGQVMQVGGLITLAAPAAGQAGIEAGFGAGLMTGALPATIDGGLVRLASPSPFAPSVLGETGNAPLTLGAGLTVEVTGYGLISNAYYYGANPLPLVNAGTIDVASGGALVVRGDFSSTGAIDVAGTLDLSQAQAYAIANPIQMDGPGAKLVVGRGQPVTISGLSAGQSVDFTKATPVADMYATVSGGRLEVLGPDGTVAGSIGDIAPPAPGIQYQLMADGVGGVSVTPLPTVGFADQTKGTAADRAFAPIAPGSPGYLHWQFIDTSPDTVAMTSAVANVFLKGGTGTKAMAATTGQNVLDGGFGSSFLSGGSGTDTFFVDVRGTNTVWDTLTNFHAGDAVTVWGWAPGAGTKTIDPLAGAGAYQGATLRLTGAADGPVSSITFAGMSTDQVAHLQSSSGVVGGLSYLYLASPGA